MTTSSLSTTMTAPYTYHYYSLQSVAAQAYATFRRHLTSVLFSNSLLGGHAPNPGDTELSTPWLQTLLISSGGAFPKEAMITSVECKGLDGNRGLVSDVTHVQVTYTILNKPKDSTSSTTSLQDLYLILKRSYDGRKSRFANILSGSAREAIFYSSNLARSLLPSTLLPKVYYAHGSSFLGEYVILMEDIKQRGNGQGLLLDETKKPIDVNYIFGDPPYRDRDARSNVSDQCRDACSTLERSFPSPIGLAQDISMVSR
ncbi:hypothetical protein BGZ82_001627 [Podila clonocystis]|nr:hypothetical protein BGZ82_001627 [Podila clonocystis]